MIPSVRYYNEETFAPAEEELYLEDEVLDNLEPAPVDAEFYRDEELETFNSLSEFAPKPKVPTLTLSDPRACVQWEKGHCMIVGTPESGKTTLLKYFIRENRKKFNRFVILCPTADNQEAYDYLPSKDVHTEDVSVELIYEIIEEQKKNPKRRLLLVLDDCIGIINMKHKVFDMLCTQGRHVGITIMLITQHLNRVITPMFRECLRTVYVTKIKDSAISTMKDLVSGFRSEREFREFLDVVSVNYQICKFDMCPGYNKICYQVFKIDPNMGKFVIRSSSGSVQKKKKT